MTLTEELRGSPSQFADLPEDGLEWLAAQMTRTDFAPGEIIIPEGSPADRMFVLLDGRNPHPRGI